MKLLEWVVLVNISVYFLSLELRRCRFRHFQKFNALFSAVSSFHRFSNLTLSNIFLCSLFYGQ